MLPADTMPDIGEDAPVEFDVGRLPNRLNDFAVAMGSGSVQHVEPLVNRIEVMLANTRPILSQGGGTASVGGALRYGLEGALGSTGPK